MTPSSNAASAPLRLDQLKSHHWATVLDIAIHGDARDREVALRLTEIGFVPGEAVRVMARGAPGRDPLAVRVGHSTFALRKHEAALVRVLPEGTAHG